MISLMGILLCFRKTGSCYSYYALNELPNMMDRGMAIALKESYLN